MHALIYNIKYTLARWSALEADRIETRRQAGIVTAYEAQSGKHD